MRCLFVIWLTTIFTSSLPGDDATLWKTFRSEFVEITPGQGKFPDQFALGCREDGNPKPRTTRFSQSFFVGKYEVPQNLWQAVMGSNPSRWKGPRNSVEMLSYSEAREFCRRVTRQLRALELIETNQHVRLPTEEEWEYVARAGTTTKYSFGDDDSLLNDYAWSTHNAAGNDPPVGAKKPNPWGLYDIHGYLWEWCDSASKETEGDNATAALRSGSWKDRAERLQSCSRRVVAKTLKDDAVGLRCVLAWDKNESPVRAAP